MTSSLEAFRISFSGNEIVPKAPLYPYWAASTLKEPFLIATPLSSISHEIVRLFSTSPP